jgi:hypothetical protein
MSPNLACISHIKLAPTCLREIRGGRLVQDELVPLLRQSVYSRLAEHEDANDAVRLTLNWEIPV